METNNSKTIYLLLGVGLLIGGIANMFSPNFGLSSASGAEAFGYNFSIIFLPILGAFLLYKAFKKTK